MREGNEIHSEDMQAAGISACALKPALNSLRLCVSLKNSRHGVVCSASARMNICSGTGPAEAAGDRDFAIGVGPGLNWTDEVFPSAAPSA
jgi:hypothetical protein